ncbi:MAG: EAL domain-containing protein [bacterium]|nr:EAL domain-containing protein [bacterium]
MSSVEELEDDTLQMDPAEHLIICVDDDQNFLKSLEFFLPEKINQETDGQTWYRFLFFDNPHLALDTLKELIASQETVAMVISDQKMPSMKGTEFLAEVKKISQHSIRVLLTGYAGVESAVVAINENLLDKYLTKPIEDEHDFIISIKHLLQKFRMQGTIAHQAKIIHELYQFSNILNGIEDFQKMLDYIVSFTGRMLKCQRISLMLDDGGLLRIKASMGVPAGVVNATSIPIGERISGTVFRSKKAILAKSLDQVPYLDGRVEVNAQSFISIPILLASLTSGDQPLGVINITQKEDNLPFTEDDLDILTYIANTASIAIHNQINRLKLQQAYVETKTQAAALEYQARHDALTGLPNRNMLKECLREAILAGESEKKPFGLLIMDLNRFKEVNDTLGHNSGDVLLQQIGQRLRQALPEEDVLARLGGDEFAVFLPGADIEAAIGVARLIIQTLREPFTLEGLTLDISTSLGLSLYPDHGQEVNLLIQRADVAMYQAKNSGSGYSVYDPAYDQYNHRRLAMIGGLRRAIEDNQLVLYYQPKIDLKTGCICGLEALVRWQHPEYGFMPPDQFIQLAEQTDLIRPLTLWVLNEALKQSSQLLSQGIEISMAVNLSIRNLQDENFPDQVRELLEKWGISPNLLELEITETNIMANPELAMCVLKRLSNMGIHLAIDDFGTGQSSLAYVKRLPVHEIKIDKSFVMSMEANNSDVMIVNTAVDLGHNLGLSVVAEGVENKETYDRLAILGCNVAQGYFISRPLPATQLVSWIHESRWGLKNRTE